VAVRKSQSRVFARRAFKCLVKMCLYPNIVLGANFACVRFAEDFQKAAPLMDAEHQISPNKTLEDWADSADAARQKLWSTKIQPLVDRHSHVPLSGIAIHDSIEKQITPAMEKFSPAEAAKMHTIAKDFMAGQHLVLNVGDAEAAIEHLNAQLSSTGYWSKMPSERAALLKTNGEIGGYKAAADAIRDELYNRLSVLEPQSDMRELKSQYGALRNVGNEIRGQVNVQGRQSPVSLKEAIGGIIGLAHGGPVGFGIAALPVVDRAVNSPEKMIGRAVQKAARPGEEGIISKAVQGTGKAAAAVLPAAGAVSGEQIDEAIPKHQ